MTKKEKEEEENRETSGSNLKERINNWEGKIKKVNSFYSDTSMNSSIEKGKNRVNIWEKDKKKWLLEESIEKELLNENSNSIEQNIIENRINLDSKKKEEIIERLNICTLINELNLDRCLDILDYKILKEIFNNSDLTCKKEEKIDEVWKLSNNNNESKENFSVAKENTIRAIICGSPNIFSQLKIVIEKENIPEYENKILREAFKNENSKWRWGLNRNAYCSLLMKGINDNKKKFAIYEESVSAELAIWSWMNHSSNKEIISSELYENIRKNSELYEKLYENIGDAIIKIYTKHFINIHHFSTNPIVRSIKKKLELEEFERIEENENLKLEREREVKGGVNAIINELEKKNITKPIRRGYLERELLKILEKIHSLFEKESIKRVNFFSVIAHEIMKERINEKNKEIKEILEEKKAEGDKNKNDLNDAIREKEESKNKIASLEEEINNKKDEIKNLEEAIIKSNKREGELLIENGKKENKIAELENNVENLESKQIYLNDLISSKEEEIIKKGQINEERNKILEASKNEIMSNMEKIEKLNSKCEKKEEEILSIRNENEKIKEKLEIFNSEKETEKETDKEIIKEKDDKIEKLENREKILTEKINEYEKEINREEENKNKSIEEENELKRTLNKEISALKSNLSEKNKEINYLKESSKREIEEKIEIIKNEKNRLEINLKNTTANKEILTKKLEGLERKQKTEEKEKELEKNKTNKENEKKALEIEKLNKQLEKKNSEIEFLTQKNKTESDHYNNEIREKNEQLESKDEEISFIERNIEEEKENTNLQIKNLKSEIERIKLKNNDLSRRESLASTTSTNDDKSFQTLSTELESLKEKNRKEIIKNENLKKEYEKKLTELEKSKKDEIINENKDNIDMKRAIENSYWGKNNFIRETGKSFANLLGKNGNLNNTKITIIFFMSLFFPIWIIDKIIRIITKSILKNKKNKKNKK